MYVILREIENKQYSSVLIFFISDEKSSGEIKEFLDPEYGDSFSSIDPIKKSFTKFQHRYTFVFYAPTPGDPRTATTEESMKKVQDLELADRRLNCTKIAWTRDILKHCMSNMPHDILDGSKLSAQWGETCPFRTRSKVRPPKALFDAINPRYEWVSA